MFSRARRASGRFFMFSVAKASERASRWGQLTETEMIKPRTLERVLSDSFERR